MTKDHWMTDEEIDNFASKNWQGDLGKWIRSLVDEVRHRRRPSHDISADEFLRTTLKTMLSVCESMGTTEDVVERAYRAIREWIEEEIALNTDHLLDVDTRRRNSINAAIEAITEVPTETG